METKLRVLVFWVVVGVLRCAEGIDKGINRIVDALRGGEESK